MEDARDLVGCTALVLLGDASDLGFTGIEGEGPFLCRVTAVDEIGIWVENRRFVTVELRDEKGRAVPKARRRPRTHTVDILLPWRNVRTVVRFEDAAELPPGAELGAGAGKRTIGFDSGEPRRR